MTIGERIKQRRKQLKMSADELGSRLGVNRSTVFRYESGFIEKLPIDILDPIAKALDTTPQYLMGWANDDTGILKNRNNTLSEITLKLKDDRDLLSMVEALAKLDPDKRNAVKSVILALTSTN